MGRAGLRISGALLAVVTLTAGCEYITNASRTCRLGGTAAPSLSRDGRYVAFESVCTRDTVVGGPLTGETSDGLPPYSQVYVRDLATGAIEGVSYAHDGGSGDDASSAPQISGDGRKVVFASLAGNLVANDGNADYDVFVRDLTTDVTTRVSVSSTGGDANAGSSEPVISDNGNIVLFSSPATNIAPVAPGSGTHLFRTDLVSGITTRVAIPTPAFSPKLSDDGRYMAYEGNLGRIFRHDFQLGTTTTVSVNQNGVDANNFSTGASISGDGRYVAFASSATDIVGLGDENGLTDMFVRDMQTGITRRANLDLSGDDANGGASYGFISLNGRFLAFLSSATDLVADDVHGIPQIYVRDLFSGRTSVVTADAAGDPTSILPIERQLAISGDGRYVAFISQDHGLDGSNDNNYFDVFVRFSTRPLVKTVAPATVARGSTATLTLTGTGFFTNTRVAFSGQGVQVTNIVFVNPKTLNVTVSVAANAATGLRHVAAKTPGSGPGSTRGAAGDPCIGCLRIT